MPGALLHAGTIASIMATTIAASGRIDADLETVRHPTSVSVQFAAAIEACRRSTIGTWR